MNKELEVLKEYANESIENNCDKETINSCYNKIKQHISNQQSKLDKTEEVFNQNIHGTDAITSKYYQIKQILKE